MEDAWIGKILWGELRCIKTPSEKETKKRKATFGVSGHGCTLYGCIFHCRLNFLQNITFRSALSFISKRSRLWSLLTTKKWYSMFKIDYILSVLADMMITGETQFVKILTKTSEKQSWYKCAAPVGFNLQIKKKPNLVHYSCLFILYCLLYACVYVIPKSNLLHFCLHVLCLCVFLSSTKRNWETKSQQQNHCWFWLLLPVNFHIWIHLYLISTIAGMKWKWSINDFFATTYDICMHVVL